MSARRSGSYCLNRTRFENLWNTDVVHAHKHRPQTTSQQQGRPDCTYGATADDQLLGFGATVFLHGDARSAGPVAAPGLGALASQIAGCAECRCEVGRLLEAAPGIKYKAILGTAYGAGLRVSEVASLKVDDIDSTRMLIRVEQGVNRRRSGTPPWDPPEPIELTI